MRIGIDLSILQSDHRLRGIGSVVINFINSLEDSDKKAHTFIFFIEAANEELAFESLDLSHVSYEVVYMENKRRVHLPGKLNIFAKILYKLIGYVQYHTGDPRIKSSVLETIDRFVQFDPNRKLPKRASKHTVLFLHDIIPYVLESDYLWTFTTARRKGYGLKGAAKCAFKRWQYKSRIKINTKRAKILVANSEHTKKDFIKYLHVAATHIQVIHLGVAPAQNTDKITPLTQYRTTMWGTVEQTFRPIKPFILFIGGTDHRRKLVELLAAFNNLRARGLDISLVLSGDFLKGMLDIKNPVIKHYLENNPSYSNDIHLLGYVSNQQRDWLYKHALVFVFPSVYEGFGLPVIEAMSHGTPVITFKNTSLVELAGTKALYTQDYLDIARGISRIYDDQKYAAKISKEGIAHARKFSWNKAKTHILAAIGA